MYVRETSTRFSRGMSIPAIRAIASALPLLVLGVLADDHHGAVAPDDLAVVAPRLDGCSDLHRVPRLLQTVRDPTPSEVVWRQLDADPVAWQDPDEVHPELAADVREDAVPVFQLHREHRVRQRLDDGTFDFDRVLLRQPGSLVHLSNECRPGWADTRTVRISTLAGSDNTPRPARPSSGSPGRRP